MNIEIELKDRKLEMNVSSVHAIILWHFQNKGEQQMQTRSIK